MSPPARRALTVALYAGALVGLVPNVLGFVWTVGFGLAAPALGSASTDLGAMRMVFPVSRALGVIGYLPIVAAWAVVVRSSSGASRGIAFVGLAVALLALVSRALGTLLGASWDLVELAEPIDHAAGAALLAFVPAARPAALAALVAAQMQVVAGLALALLPPDAAPLLVGGMLVALIGALLTWGFLVVALFRARPAG